MSNVQKLVESHHNELRRRQQRIVEAWTPHINAINEHMKTKNGRSMTELETYNVAQCLENALENSSRGKGAGKLFEATAEDSIEFLGIQLPVIAALLPSLCLNEIASVQALDRRQGAVFYMDVQYGTDKGNVSEGDTMLSSFTGHNRTVNGRQYASTLVKGESTGLTSTGTCTVSYAPGVDVTSSRTSHPERTVYLKDSSGTVVASDADTAGTLKTSGGSTVGTINAAGLLDITSIDGDSDGYTIDYCYQYDLPQDDYENPSGVPEANVAMAQSTVTALDFPIRSKYSLGAAIDVQRAHGVNLESELTKYLGGEVRFTIDHFGIDMIDKVACGQTDVADPYGGADRTAADTITQWSAAINSGQEWIWKKNELMDRFEEGNNNIIAKTLRAVATFIVCGNNVARVVRQLPNFKPASAGKTPPTGPYKMGTLDGRTVVHDPFLADYGSNTGADRYVMGYKGDSFLTAGFAYCPYIPLMSTPTLVTSDLMAQKGFLSSAGFKVINPGMYTYGTITGLGTQATVS